LEHPSIIFKIVCPDRPGLVSLLTSWISNYGGNIKHSDHHTDQDAGLFLSRIEWNSNNESLNRDEIYKEFEKIANDFNAKFVHIDTFKIDKSVVEDQFLNLLKEYEIDLVVLAKYMQILSDSFLKKFSSIINIHHSFLPAFKGAQPYHRAWKRGVKLIGATAHYVTEDLDEGPIIEQCTVNVSHRDEVDDLIRKGRDIERIALARAVRLHINHQVFVYNSKTAVFD